MRYNRLGGSGLNVSALGLGTNSFGSRADERASAAIIDRALELGINFIDTANIYSRSESEAIIGRALEGRRQEVILATKAGLVKDDTPNGRGSSRHHLQTELEASLKRLKTDYVDLYQIHTFDPATPLGETLRALDDFVRAGKVRYIGASNYAAWELMKALGISDRLGLHRFVSTQISYSLADRAPELELVPMCLDQGVGIIPYFPLAGGILTGKYNDGNGGAPAGSRLDKNPDFAKYMSEERMELGRRVSRIAAESGHAPGVLALAWLIAKPAVATVIVGATGAEQLADNAAGAAIAPEAGVLDELEAASRSFRRAEPMAFFRLPGGH